MPIFVPSLILLPITKVLQFVALILVAGLTEHSGASAAGDALMLWIGCAMLLDLLAAGLTAWLLRARSRLAQWAWVIGQALVGIGSTLILTFVGMVLMNR